MKRVCIFWHMSNAEETAESCITVSMKASYAEELLRAQDDWWGMQDGFALRSLLEQLSVLAGYEYECFCKAEE